LKKKTIIIIGSGGHSRIVSEIAILLKYNVKGILDINFKKKKTKEFINSIPVLGGEEELKKFDNKSLKLFIAIGDCKLRKIKYDYYSNLGFEFVNLIHPLVSISKSIKIGSGVMIASGAIINSNVQIKNNVIINSGSIIEHEVIIGNHCHCGPGSIIAGRVKISDGVFLGIGSKIIDNLSIGSNSILGAGSVIIFDIPKNSTVVGVPGVILNKK
jgi:sugar O-acyltransferase (sialic acid O-acetyltransferase NeuD family)